MLASLRAWARAAGSRVTLAARPGGRRRRRGPCLPARSALNPPIAVVGPPKRPGLLSRQETRTHQELVDSASTLPAFADRPDDERLAAPHVAGGEQLRNRGAIVDGIGADIAAGIELDTGLLDHAGLARPEKAHCQEDEISLQIEGATRNLLHHKAAVWPLRPVDPNAIESCDPSVFPDSAFGQHRPVALAALFLR